MWNFSKKQKKEHNDNPDSETLLELSYESKTDDEKDKDEHRKLHIEEQRKSIIKHYALNSREFYLLEEVKLLKKEIEDLKNQLRIEKQKFDLELFKLKQKRELENYNYPIIRTFSECMIESAQIVKNKSFKKSIKKRPIKKNKL